RQGIVVRPWVYDALALGLDAIGSPDEAEQARLSAIDLQPKDAASFVQAAKGLGDQQRQYDRAVALCRQAATLEPNASYPYEEALVYAELAQDPSGMKWAAGGLLRQDWPVDNQDLHAKAGAKLKDLVKRLAAGQRTAEADRLLQAAKSLEQRDLVI